MPPPEPEPQPEREPEPEPEHRRDGLPTDWLSRDTARQEPRWGEDEAVAAPPRFNPASAPAPAADEAAPAPPAPVVPEFMRRAQSSARWKQPGVRAALAVMALLLASLLSLQVVVHFRDAMAALHPPLREPLKALCAIAGCELHPWKRIEALSIDATSLNPVGSGSYKLTLSLRNKTAVAVAAPSVELSLTDANGAPLARRVLGPETMNPALTQVNADSEQSLTLIFSTGGQRVSGYNVSIFYP